MAKRGSSGLSLVVGVRKPCGMSSHDVVNRVRRIFGERRVGHTGTLDPLASGALAVCVGPATRLDAYLTGHDKTYRVRVAFGIATTTDDAEGEVLKTLPVPPELSDEDFARAKVAELVGEHRQLPPVYSAIKVNGQKAYEAARKGNVIDLTPRAIHIYTANLLGMGTDEEGALWWDVEVRVSKGTYVRSIARDLGVSLGTCAHVARLERTVAGNLWLDDCISLEVLEEQRERAALDPVRLLGLRFVYADEACAKDVQCGRPLKASAVTVCERPHALSPAMELCACTTGVVPSCRGLEAGETVCVIADNKLVALYAFDARASLLKPACVFSTGVSRGTCV